MAATIVQAAWAIVQTDWRKCTDVGLFLANLQDQIHGMLPYEQTGMRNIARTSPEAYDA